MPNKQEDRIQGEKKKQTNKKTERVEKEIKRES